MSVHQITARVTVCIEYTRMKQYLIRCDTLAQLKYAIYKINYTHMRQSFPNSIDGSKWLERNGKLFLWGMF